MESFLNRYRNITVLLLVIFAQLILLAVQVKNDQHVRFIRVWSVTAVSPCTTPTPRTAACRPKWIA
jgi:rod shape-determining protein MreC